MPRPRSKLPDDEIAWRGRQGQGAPSIHAALVARGIVADPRTVGHRLAELRAKGWPGADTYAASIPTAKRPSAGNTRSSPAGDAVALSEGEEFTDDALARLPADLLARASRQTARALKKALALREVIAVDKLASVLERFSRRLVECRPPERVEPVKDPTNLAARREVLARWELLRAPIEVALPTVEAIEAHAAALRARAIGTAGQ